MSTKSSEPSDVRTQVREAYGNIADRFQGEAASCCSGGSSLSAVSLYEDVTVADLPTDVTGLSLGCGDPVTLASLQPGQTVLDLGSGGGIDCFLAAKQVGAEGRVIGVDMTAQMIEKARANKSKVDAENVDFRLGEIEHLPVADNSVDVIISNCVVNLSPDKPQVFRDAFRVLKPGGRIAISDMMSDIPLPAEIQNSISSWAGCIGGALAEADYIAAIKAAGFVDIKVERNYPDESLKAAALEQAGIKLDEAKNQLVVNAGTCCEMIELDHIESLPNIFSGKVTAYKPEV